MDALFINTDPEKVEELLHYHEYDGKDALNYQAEQYTLFGEKKYEKTIIKMFEYDFDKYEALPNLGALLGKLPDVCDYINEYNYIAVLGKLSRRSLIKSLLPELRVVSPAFFDCVSTDVALISATCYSRAMVDTAIATSMQYKNTRNVLHVKNVRYFKERLSNVSVLITAITQSMYDFVDAVAPLHADVLPHVLTLYRLSEEMIETITKHIK